MDLLKLSTDWAKAEIFSAKIVWLFSLILIATAVGFWYLGKTSMAKAFVWPILISAILLIVIAGGLFYANKPRVTEFEQAYQNNPGSFLQQELIRTAKSNNDFAVVFKVLPVLLIAAGLLILFLPSTRWRSIGITLGFLAVFLMALDSNTAARNEQYREQLKKISNEQY
jgi:ABC-2 type transport system permease protein